MSFETLYFSNPIFAGILAVVGVLLAFSIVYYTIKGLLYLVQLIVKLSLNFTKGIFKGALNLASLPIKSDKKQKQERLAVENHQRKNEELEENQNTIEFQLEENQEILYQFCPNCGERFNSRVQAEFHRNGKCFCHNCGNLAHI